ncbi:MAG: hypothetical protein Q8942_02550, partial [Bacillota bacterium]|nr:hypothetical protein [Bacillota bacterium]
TEIMDLDNDGNIELVTTSVGIIPSFVWIYRWNSDHYEKMDVAKVTQNDYATILNRGNSKIWLEAGKTNVKHFYLYKDGTLEEHENTKEALLKEKVTPMYFNTYVKKEVWGKQGPGENYENLIKLPYGRVIQVTGMYTVNGGNGGWYLAKLAPELTDDRETRQLPENQTEFWLYFDSIGMKYEHKVIFEECSINDAVQFNYVITGKAKNDGTIRLRQLPDENSPTVSIANQGNLINVVQKDGQWSVARITSGRAMEDYSDIGWIKNSDYTQYKSDQKVNQGFLIKPVRLYDRPDSSSDPLPVDNVIKYDVAPVTIDEQKSNSNWSYIRGSFNGFAGWVNTKDIHFTFTSEEAVKIANPDIDLKMLTQKIKDEIKDWDGLTLNALDIDKQVRLNQQQRKELSDNLKGVTGYEVNDGGLTTYREAMYPFYTLQFLTGKNDYYIDENSADPQDKLYRASYCKYNFIVTGEDTIMILIPTEKLDYYGLKREGAPVKFLKVNREFVQYIKNLIPANELNINDGFNYLLNAVKVKVGSEQGEAQKQVYKCARVIRSYAGKEIETGRVPKNVKAITSFEFKFKNGSVEKVIVTDKYISYRGKYFSLNGDPKSIGGILFAGYF